MSIYVYITRETYIKHVRFRGYVLGSTWRLSLPASHIMVSDLGDALFMAN